MDKKPTSKPSKSSALNNKATSKAAPKKLKQEQIAVRAYFISQQRQQMGLAGDHLSDWMEAERQLMGEK